MVNSLNPWGSWRPKPGAQGDEIASAKRSFAPCDKLTPYGLHFISTALSPNY
jgi:hypothetical protein